MKMEISILISILINYINPNNTLKKVELFTSIHHLILKIKKMIYNSEVQDTTIRKATTTRNTQAIAKRLEFQVNVENFKFEIKNNSFGKFGNKIWKNYCYI